MKLNVGVPNSMHVAAMTQAWEYSLTGDDIGQAMATADRLGFNKCMLGEHFIIPQEHIGLSGDHYVHGTVALSFLAGRTKSRKKSKKMGFKTRLESRAILKSYIFICSDIHL